MQHQEIVFGVAGQRFVFDPPDGRPDASPTPTVHVIGGGAATIGACTIDPVDTTLYGDAHAGSKQLRVESVEGMAVGVRYLMTKPEGEHEWIEIAAIGEENALTLRHPLIHRYAGAATIVGCRISCAIDQAWVSSSANRSDGGGGLAGYMLRWMYTFGGVEVQGISFADLVACRADQVVTPEDLARRVPGWDAKLPEAHRANHGADFIAEAFRVVRMEAVGDDHAQRKIRDTTVLRELVNVRADVIRLEHEVMYGAPLGEELQIAERRYRTAYSRLVDVTRYGRRAAEVEPTREEPANEPSFAKGSSARRRVPKLTGQ
jgi:hypothetical protein